MSSPSSTLQELEQALAGSLDCPAGLGGLLSSFLHGAGATEAINHLLTMYLQHSGTRELARLDGESLLLMQNERFALSLKLVSKKSDLLHTSGIDRITAFRSASPVTVDRYRIVGRFEPDIFNPEATLERVDSRPSDGSYLHERQLDPYIHDSHSASPFIVAQLVRYPASSQVWFFHRTTLRAAFPAVGYSTLSGYVLLSRMVAAAGERRALPLLEQLATHEAHTVRWAAIQAIGKLDGAAGRAWLEKSLSDGNPHISNAAAKVLAKLAR
jgi:hypothetical protein